MSPQKRGKSKRSAVQRKKAKPARRAKSPRAKKTSRKRSTSKGKAAPVVFRRKGKQSGAADTVDTLGEWQPDHEEDRQQYNEDDIPPDYGGSE